MENRRKWHIEQLPLKELQDISLQLSKQIIQMTTHAASGHPSSSLSIIDILTVLYFGGILRYDPEDPSWPERDRFILSKGHAAPALYAVLAKAGYFSPDHLSNLRKLNSPAEGHPNMRALPGVEASTGSLGQGLSIGLGHALAARVKNLASRVYVLIGDGEADEGQVWEAAMAAAKYQVNHLTAILDYNKYQQTGSVQDVMPSLEPIVDKWEAFGWYVVEADGHRIADLVDCFQTAQTIDTQPQLVIAHTLKGKGLSPFEKDEINRKHGVPLKPEEASVALKELDEMQHTVAYSSLNPKEKPVLTPENKYGELKE